MLPPAKHFTDLVVWQKAHALVLELYRQTATFPKHELYGLTSQLRRAAISVPANIAEGFRKRSKADKARFMNIAQGSLEEAHYYIILARDLQYFTNNDVSNQLLSRVDEVSHMLSAYITPLLSA